MKKVIAATVICLAASMATAAGDLRPLNAKTGFWRITETITWTGLPPQYAAMMRNARPINYHSCVKEKDLSSNPWADGSGEKCNWTALKSSSSDMEVEARSCQMGTLGTADVHGTVHMNDSENGTGTFSIVVTANGQVMNGHAMYTGKWVSATCPNKLD
jgi:Protein of unknown function (DUF3617)